MLSLRVQEILSNKRINLENNNLSYIIKQHTKMKKKFLQNNEGKESHKSKNHLGSNTLNPSSTATIDYVLHKHNEDRNKIIEIERFDSLSTISKA